MPVLTRRQHMMLDSPRASTDSNSSTKEHIWIVEEDFEKPQKEMDFPSASLNGKMPRHDLRIHTYSKPDLHDRYMSSEEEPSPSPDSSDVESTHSEEAEELEHKSSSRILATEAPLDLSAIEFDGEIQTAVAVPIAAYGRPKLIDISSLAPMQKRKRAIKPPVAPSSVLNKTTTIRSIPTATDENKPFVANEAAELVVPAEKFTAVMATNKHLKEGRLSRSQSHLPVSSAPEFWLPEEEDEPTSDDERDRYSFYWGYEPYSLEAIHQSSYSNHTNPALQNHGHNRKRNNSNPFNQLNTPSLSGLTRKWSLAKKGVHRSSNSQQQQQPQGFSQRVYYAEPQPERQITKKPKMVARGANERQETPVIPAFPFEGGIAA